MLCPQCNKKARVVETRHNEHDETFRQHECSACGHVFYTLEFIEEFEDYFKKEWMRNDRRLLARIKRTRQKGDKKHGI